MKRSLRRSAITSVCLLLLAAAPIVSAGTGDAGRSLADPTDTAFRSPGGQVRLEPVLIRTARPYESVAEAIRSAGGTITREYRHFDGLAARVPRSALPGIGRLIGPGSLSKDGMVSLPRPPGIDRSLPAGLPRTGDERLIPFEAAEAIPAAGVAAFAAAHPEAYLINNTLSNVDPLHADGFGGQGIVVAVIDSGIRPGFFHLESDGSIIGCEDFVGDGFGCSNPGNSGHGTFVAGMISANAVFGFNPASGFFRSLQAHLPDAILPPNRVPMIGSAPLAGIYAMRVFPPRGGAAVSDILAAIDRAIELRVRHESAEPDGVKIQVVNMSLGGPTLFAGRDLFDRAVDALLDHDILVCTSAGNAGPSGLTTGSPGSSLSSLAVGAASIAGYERILTDLRFGPGVGFLYRASDHVQTAVFSSRGPNADGRFDPEVIASGDASFGQGFSSTNSVNFSSGTSFSSPTVAGIAAVLRQAFPEATARQVHNAIRNSAAPGVLGDGSTVHDRGAGYVDASTARALLASGSVPDALPSPPHFVRSVKDNLGTNAGLTVDNGTVERIIGPLRPGQREEVIYEVTPNTAQVRLELTNFRAELPPSQQNQLFGDDLFVAVHNAKTSRQPESSGYLIQAFTTGGTAVIPDPEPGLMRFTISGDWTNAGDVSVDLRIVPATAPTPRMTRQGKIMEFEEIVHALTVPPGTSRADFRLRWRENWTRYPLNDIDLVLIDPDGGLNFGAATLDAPERVVVESPQPGTWLMIVYGFELHSSDDKYDLRVELDGQVVK